MEELVIRKTTLKNKIHNVKPGVMVSDAALELMQDEIDLLSEVLIKLAIEETNKRERKKINEQDVEKAFKKLIRNADAIDQTINNLNEIISKLETMKEKSVSKYIEEV